MGMTEPHGLMGRLMRGRPGVRVEITPAMRAVLEAASPGLALLDAKDRILAWNPELGRLCGPSLPLRPGMPAAALIEPGLRDSAVATLAAGRPAEAALAAAGTPRVQMERRDLPLREPAALLRVSSLAAAEEPRRNDAAARLQAIGALAGGIAHDFNNLLAAIGGSAEAALAQDAAGPVSAELRQIMESAARGAGLVRQLLAFARQQPLSPRVVELNEAVAAIGEMLRRLLGRGVHLTLALGEPGRQVCIDPTQLDQLIVNLALNARDSMPEGGSLRIATSQALVLRPEPIGQEELPPGRYAVIEVRDTGGGIPQELLPRIFEPFFTTKRERGGTGLGLSTVHGIVRQSGGYIAVTSRVGEGTTFRIWLPRHEGVSERAPSAAIAAPAPPPASAPVTPAGPILLVEDEPRGSRQSLSPTW
jgi:two-component system cell cycle sensor histidine kinase/response regulator CckA